MAGKNKYSFTLDGKQYTRISDRKYLYAVVARHARGEEVSYATTKERAEVRAKSFRGMREFAKDPITKRNKPIGPHIYESVRIITL